MVWWVLANLVALVGGVVVIGLMYTHPAFQNKLYGVLLSMPFVAVVHLCLHFSGFKGPGGRDGLPGWARALPWIAALGIALALVGVAVHFMVDP